MNRLNKLDDYKKIIGFIKEHFPGGLIHVDSLHEFMFEELKLNYPARWWRLNSLIKLGYLKKEKRSLLQLTDKKFPPALPHMERYQ